MADVSKINLYGTDYIIKDNKARTVASNASLLQVKPRLRLIMHKIQLIMPQPLQVKQRLRLLMHKIQLIVLIVKQQLIVLISLNYQQKE